MFCTCLFYIIVGRISCRRIPSSAVSCSCFTRNLFESKIGPKLCSCVPEILAVFCMEETSSDSTASEASSSFVFVCTENGSHFGLRVCQPVHCSHCLFLFMWVGCVRINMFLAHTWLFNVCLFIRLMEQWKMTCRSARLVQPVVSGVYDSSPPHLAASCHLPAVSRRLHP